MPPPDGEVQTLAPLTNELITHVLTERGYHFGVDDDGDVGGMWDDNVIYFFRRGSDNEILQIRILSNTDFTVDDVPQLYEFCNEWNHDRLWPKAFVHVADDGTARVCGEITTDLERGVSIAQLDQLMECGIATGCQLASAAAELKS